MFGFFPPTDLHVVPNPVDQHPGIKLAVKDDSEAAAAQNTQDSSQSNQQQNQQQSQPTQQTEVDTSSSEEESPEAAKMVASDGDDYMEKKTVDSMLTSDRMALYGKITRSRRLVLD